MKAVHVPNLHEFPDTYEPGQYCFHKGRFWFVCPGPCKALGAICIDGSAESGKNWTWDGNVDAPTLTPSINHLQCWHGWLKAGEFT